MSVNNLQDGLFKADKESLYDFQHTIKDNRKNLGRNFTKDLLFINISRSIYRNAYMKDFVLLLQNILVKYVYAVTYLKIYKSFTVDKNYKKVR